MYHFVLAATIGAAAVLTTACNGNNPNVPSQKEIETKIIGKWKRVAINGDEELTNHRQICTYETDGKAVYSESVFRGNHWVWSNHQEGSYTIDGNTLSAKIPNHEMVRPPRERRRHPIHDHLHMGESRGELIILSSLPAHCSVCR